MLRIRRYCLSGLVIAAMVAGWGPWGRSARSAVEPSIVPVSWQLEFEYQAPRLIWVSLPDKDQPQPFWYMTYMVTNNTGQDRNWVPAIEIYTDQGDLIPAGRGVPPKVIHAIKAEQKNPLLKGPVESLGRLRQGADQPVESMIVWPAGDKDVDQVTIFIAGLSGETQAVRLPDSDKVVLLRKTRMLQFAMPGTPADVVVKPVALQQDQWIMR